MLSLSLALTHLPQNRKKQHRKKKTLSVPSRVIILVKAGSPVDGTISGLLDAGLEPGDIIIDGGNEWYENTERRSAEVAKKGVRYIGMGVSGGEEGARNGPSMMPGGDKAAFDAVEPVLTKVAAQVDDGKKSLGGVEREVRGRGRTKPRGQTETHLFQNKKNAQIKTGPCTMYVGPGGAGNFVKMVHNGIEYGDMQLISEAYDILRTVGKL